MGQLIDEMIDDTPYMAAAEEAANDAAPRVDTVGEALGPVVSWEKGDVEFWVQIAQLAVLLLILREVS